MKKNKTHQRQASKWKFHKVLDTRGKPVPNLWQRNGRYYAQLTLREEGKVKNTKLPLKATTLSEAKSELEDLRVKRRNNQLAPVTKTPRFHAYCDDYMQHKQQIQRKKGSEFLPTVISRSSDGGCTWEMAESFSLPPESEKVWGDHYVPFGNIVSAAPLRVRCG